MLPNDSLAMEWQREQLASLDAVLRHALGNGALDPDWKRNEAQLLDRIHQKQQGKKEP